VGRLVLIVASGNARASRGGKPAPTIMTPSFSKQPALSLRPPDQSGGNLILVGPLDLPAPGGPGAIPRAMRVFVKIAASVLVLYQILLAGLLLVMRRPTPFGKVMRHMPGPAFAILPFKRLWFVARAGRLKPGDAAPDFTLMTSDKKSRVQLSSFRGRQPVVLVFGSYT
jgi:hypothetical protein